MIGVENTSAHPFEFAGLRRVGRIRVFLRAESSSCVVVGSFNIYIFSPDWVQKAFGIPDEPEIEVDLNSPGYRLESSLFGFVFVVRPDRISFEAVASPEKGGGIPISWAAHEILKKLPETPIRGIGHNFVYSVENASLAQQTLAPLEFLRTRNSHVDAVGTTARIQIGDQRYTLAINTKLTEGISMVRANVHTEIPEKNNPLACEVLQRFDHHRVTSEDLISGLWKV